MRTTLSLDDDVLFAVKERARREHRSADAVLSDLARHALTHEHQTGQSTDRGIPRLPAPAAPGDAVSNALIDRLREDDVA